nr:MAG TPA: hypothetical protein [Caudoviricetes sp.]
MFTLKRQRFVYRLPAVREDSSSRIFAHGWPRMIRFHPSGSESLVGDERRKEDEKVTRIFFENKTKVKNAPKYVIKVHFIW